MQLINFGKTILFMFLYKSYSRNLKTSMRILMAIQRLAIPLRLHIKIEKRLT